MVKINIIVANLLILWPLCDVLILSFHQVIRASCSLKITQMMSVMWKQPNKIPTTYQQQRHFFLRNCQYTLSWKNITRIISKACRYRRSTTKHVTQTDRQTDRPVEAFQTATLDEFAGMTLPFGLDDESLDTSELEQWRHLFLVDSKSSTSTGNRIDEDQNGSRSIVF
jgi:hypothetical protein